MHRKQEQNGYHRNNEQEEAVRMIEEKLTSAEVLAHPRSDVPYIVSCDASNTGLGAVLSQKGDDGIERPVFFASRTECSGKKLLSNSSRVLSYCVGV